MRWSLAALMLLAACASTAPPRGTDVIEASDSTIDGKAVSSAAFDDFERGLSGRKDTITCAETTTGGFSEYEATDAHGMHYRIRNESRSGRSIREATRVDLDGP